MRRVRRAPKADAELDITSFMNLMIVLVPVLLLSMVFSHITVLEIKLPKSSDATEQVSEQDKQLELVIRQESMALFYPSGVLLKDFPLENDQHDFQALSGYLQALKRTFQTKNIDKRGISILPAGQTDYQTIVRAMDTVRSFKAVVAASVVDAELFPEISLGDAPELAKEAQQ